MSDDSSAAWSASFAGASTSAMEVYDQVMVPGLFDPWARLLVEALRPPLGATILDVATGPGTVARRLAERLGPGGKVVATDISSAMLAVAQAKPAVAGGAPIEYIESPAAPLAVDGASADGATCQQGLQFFPDRHAALAELRRALRPGGAVAIATWSTIDRCPPFAALQAAMADAVSADLAQRYLGPWSLHDPDELGGLLEAAGFGSVRVKVQALPFTLGGAGRFLRTLEASGVAAELAALDAGARRVLEEAARRHLAPLVDGDTLRTEMTGNVATATAPAA